MRHKGLPIENGRYVFLGFKLPLKFFLLSFHFNLIINQQYNDNRMITTTINYTTNSELHVLNDKNGATFSPNLIFLPSLSKTNDIKASKVTISEWWKTEIEVSHKKYGK